MARRVAAAVAVGLLGFVSVPWVSEASGVPVVLGAARMAQTIEEQQWHLDAMGVYQAQQVVRGDGVVVAVVDSGVDDTVPDLAGALLPGAGFGTAVGTDGTDDKDGHGTAMAALIGGRGADGGALGVAPGARILPVSVGLDAERFTTVSVASGITWAVDNGADVVNLSLTSLATLTPDLLRAVNYAFDRDVVVVAGTGNSGERHIGAPANIRGVIAVSGTEQGNAPWASSNVGPETVLAAPARGIVTAVPSAVSDTGYVEVDGTSAATALVSGAAALVRARYPEMDAGNVVNRLIATATDLGAAGRDEATGFGLVNVVGAVSAEVAPVERNPLAPPPRTSSVPSAPPTGGVPGEVAPGDPEGGSGVDRGVVSGPQVSGGVRAAVALGGLLLVAVFVGVMAVVLSRRPRGVVASGVPSVAPPVAPPVAWPSGFGAAPVAGSVGWPAEGPAEDSGGRPVESPVEGPGGRPVEGPAVEGRVVEIPPASDDFWKPNG